MLFFLIRLWFMLAFISLYSLIARENGYQFLRVGVPAKATGLGDTYVSQFGDVNTFMYNPAGLAQLSHRQFSAGYMNHILDISSGFGAYAQPYKNIGVFGVGMVYFGYGNFQGYDVNGYETNSYSSSDFALSLFYARTLREHIHVGAAIKFIRSGIDNYTSSAVAMDIGAIYVVPQYDLQVGAALLNAGIATQAALDHKESLPLSLQLGVSKKWNFITFSGCLSDLNLPGNRLERFSLSAEADPWEKISLRLGYNEQRRSELSPDGSGFLNGITGISAGIGFKHQNYVFDYSFTSWGIGAINRFSLTLNL